MTITDWQFNAKQARREAQKAAKQDNELKKQIQNVCHPVPFLLYPLVMSVGRCPAISSWPGNAPLTLCPFILCLPLSILGIMVFQMT